MINEKNKKISAAKDFGLRPGSQLENCRQIPWRQFQQKNDVKTTNGVRSKENFGALTKHKPYFNNFRIT